MLSNRKIRFFLKHHQTFFPDLTITLNLHGIVKGNIEMIIGDSTVEFILREDSSLKNCFRNIKQYRIIKLNCRIALKN